MKSLRRGIKRHHQKRIKERARRRLSIHRHRSWIIGNVEELCTKKEVGRMANAPKSCQHPYCCNPRRLKKLTLQERKAIDNEF